MTKLIYILPAAVIMFCALYGGAISVGLTQNPFKVTDPSDPRFDPTKFQFSDYDGYDGLAEALKILFEPGDSKEKIEGVLVDAGQADAREKRPSDNFGAIARKTIANTDLVEKSHSVVLHQNEMKNTFVPNAWSIHVFYDKEDKMVNIFCYDELLY